MTTSLSSAEMMKHASNAFLAMRTSCAHELGRLCTDPALDVDDVITGVGLDPRAGRALPSSGPGFGDSHLVKGTLAPAAWARARDIGTPFLDAAVEIDVRQASHRRTALYRGGERVSALSVAAFGLRTRHGATT
ncbi:hypothetical protein [Streptomyces hydrogenans]|uniref:hypothetical protein n=1 Tax=Streptomyces hydrogenans TaxID=1873719 RepID=UPI003420A6A5